jgi:hydrogenase maturation factor
MVATADPLSYIPALGARYSAWLSVNLIASDLATSGFAPEYGIFDFNLPPKMSGAEFAAYWTHFHKECKRLGIAIVGGHTGRYQGCDYTVIGGGIMCAVGPENRYLTSGMGHAGNDVILTKGAAIETTAVLATAFPRTVKKAIGHDMFARARAYLNMVSTVKDALTAVTVGVRENGVTAMHDATEGGVTAAVFELAHASRLGAELDLSEVRISAETDAICRLFRINPLTSLSEGSLIIACKPARTRLLMNRLRSAGIDSDVFGRLTKNPTLYSVDPRGRKKRLQYPRFDPYWRAYWNATARRWS